MQTVSLAEAAENFTKIVKSLDLQPLVIMDGDEEIAVIKSSAAIERERQARWAEFWKMRDAFAAEVEANLARDGITVDQFLEDVLRDE